MIQQKCKDDSQRCTDYDQEKGVEEGSSDNGNGFGIAEHLGIVAESDIFVFFCYPVPVGQTVVQSGEQREDDKNGVQYNGGNRKSKKQTVSADVLL